MARKKTRTTKTTPRPSLSRAKSRDSGQARGHEMIDVATEDLIPSPAVYRRFSTKTIAFVVLALGIIGLLLTNKGLIVAGMVNGKPIFRWELNKVLVSRFGKQTLESIISERLIADAAVKAGVTVTQQDIEAKESEIVAGLAGDVKLEELLSLQGLTKEDFDSQIKLQLTVERLLSKDVAVGEEDIMSFIETNRSTLTATDEAGLREEARQALTSQQVSEKIQPWFTELKDGATIARFIE